MRQTVLHGLSLLFLALSLACSPADRIERRSGQPSYFNNLAEGQYKVVSLVEFNDANKAIYYPAKYGRLEPREVVAANRNGRKKEYIKMKDPSGREYYFSAEADGMITKTDTPEKLQGISEGQFKPVIEESLKNDRDPLPQIEKALGTDNPFVTGEAIKKSTKGLYIFNAGRFEPFGEYSVGINQDYNLVGSAKLYPDSIVAVAVLQGLGVESNTSYMIAEKATLSQRELSEISASVEYRDGKPVITDFRVQKGTYWQAGDIFFKAFERSNSDVAGQPYRQPDSTQPSGSRQTSKPYDSGQFNDAADKVGSSITNKSNEFQNTAGNWLQDTGARLRQASREGEKRQEKQRQDDQKTIKNAGENIKSGAQDAMKGVSDLFKKK